MLRRLLHAATMLGLLWALPGCSIFQSEATASPGPTQADRSMQEPAEEGPESIADAVPEEASTDEGLFTVYQTDEELMFEIPDSLMGREMLLISRIAQVPQLGGFIPAGYKAHEQVLVWERRGERVLLRKRSYAQVAPDSLPISTSVVSNNFSPIIASFDVEAEDPDGSILIDVTSFYEGDTPAISGLSTQQRSAYGVRRLDPARSFINYGRAFPLNVDVRHTLTFEATQTPTDQNTNTLSMEMHQSMVLLPLEPMRPRYADDRVGYFSVEQVNFGIDDQKAATQTFIRRWRLEPTDPAAYARGDVVDPVKPIVYYVDPATPTRWRSCVREGVNDWQPAFETAGFSNAIMALDPPSPADDPEWDPADVRHSVVRWAASLTRNAQGPSVSDPRSGEIIESDIVWYHNHMRSYRNRIMLETGASNPLARRLPIDDGLMCEAMRQVIAHEIGHALGLPHNMVSSSAYPVDSLRVKSFAQRMGVAPTIMDYARQNYIAQPGDGLEGNDYLRQIGPYDHYVINWGYRVLPDAATPEDELATLDQWVVEKAHDRTYKYLPQGPFSDPRAQTEDLGDDAVKASGYGIANLKAVTPNLVDWTTRDGEDYTDLTELYGELLGQWSRYVGHVVNLVGGIHADLKTADQDGAVFEGVPRSRQEEAVAFVAREVFETPLWLNDPEILSLVGNGGGLAPLSGRQASVLNSLLNSGRLQRLSELEVMEPDDHYPLVEFLDDVRTAVWRAPGRTALDPYRRALQRAHLDRLQALMEESAPGAGAASRSDIGPLVRAQLRAIRMAAAGASSSDPVASAHLADVQERVDLILEGGAGS